MHDFALYKKNSLPLQAESTCCKADSGYLGLNKLHFNAQVPKKSSKHHPLTAQQKVSNHQLSSERMLANRARDRLDQALPHSRGEIPQ